VAGKVKPCGGRNKWPCRGNGPCRGSRKIHTRQKPSPDTVETPSNLRNRIEESSRKEATILPSMTWTNESEAGALCCSGTMCQANTNQNLVMINAHMCISCNQQVHGVCCQMDMNDKPICWTCQAPPNGGGKPAATLGVTDEAVAVRRVELGGFLVNWFCDSSTALLPCVVSIACFGFYFYSSSQNDIGIIFSSQNDIGIIFSSQNDIGIISSSQNDIGIISSSHNDIGIISISQNDIDL
jgi:hypothetical protein